MTIRQYLAPIFRWWWLLVVAGVTTGVTTYYAARPLPPVYVARATLLVGRGVSDPNPTGNELGLSQQLAVAYADIAGREPVQLAARTALKMGQLPYFVAQANGAFVDISVTSDDPLLARAVANELANQLILQSPANPQSADPTRQAFINQQINELQNQITQTKADIAAKQNSLAGLTSAVDIANTQNDIAALNTRLTALETNYSSLLTNSAQGAANTIGLFAAATVPSVPIGPNKPLIIALAVASGVVLAAGAAYLLEFLDNTLKSFDDITRLLPFPQIGHIAQMERVKKGVYVADRPRSIVAEAFRSLRTNIEFASAERPIKTVMVTSASAGDGKTVVASNLAITFARSGKKVILLDADMRKSGVHQVFNLSNSKGLSDVFAGSLNVLNAINPWQEEPNFGIMTVGPPSLNPTELISSRKMDDILARLTEMADLVIIDAPPFLIADAWILAAKVDAVLLVVRPGHTRKDAARAMLEQVQRVGARVIGVALNRIPRQPFGYYSPQLSPYYLQTQRQIELPAMAAKRASVKRTQASLELLNTIGQFLTTDLDLHDQWKGILQLTVERMGASSGGLLVLDEQGIVVDGAVAYKGRIRTSVMPQLTQTAEQGLAGWVIEHRQGALVQNTSQDPRWLRRSWEQAGSSSRSAISVPLMTSRGVAGVLTLTHAQAGFFSDDDLALLTVVSSCISLSGIPASKPASAGPNHQAPAEQLPQAPVAANLADVPPAPVTPAE